MLGDRVIIRSLPCEMNPAAITVSLSGLGDSFEQPYRAAETLPGVRWRGAPLKSFERPDGLPLIPYQSPPWLPPSGVYEYTGTVATAIDVLYGGRGFAVPARTEPEVLSIVAVGEGAEIDVALNAVADHVDASITSHWEVGSVSVTAGVGSGYGDFTLVQVIPSAGSICGSAASARMRTARGVPTLTATVRAVSPCNCSYPGATAGAGARFSVNYAALGTTPQTWRVASVDVIDSGSGYADGVPLDFSAGKNDTITTFPAATIIVSGGLIVGVNITNGGISFKNGVPTGVVQSLVKGAYYKPDYTLPPYWYESELLEWGLTVDSDIDSPTFGQVTAASVVEQPSVVLDVESRCDNSCFASLNDSFVLTADDADVIGSPTFAERHRAVRLCVSSPIGEFAALRVTPPENYENEPVGITDVDVIEASGMLGGQGYAEWGRVPPVFTLSESTGSGAAFSWELREEADSLGRRIWVVSSVTVTGGTGYRDNRSITQSNISSNGTLTLRLRTRRAEPSISVATCPGGSGASFDVVLAKSAGDTPVWSVSMVNILNGGSGYSGKVPLVFSVSFPSVAIRAACAIGITSGDGSIERVTIIDEGAYFLDTGIPERVDILRSGPLWRASPDEPVFAPPVTVTVTQNVPFSNGSGAEIEAVVDTDPYSPTFGRITGANVVSPGSGYVLWKADFSVFGAIDNVLLRPDAQTESCSYGLQCDLGDPIRHPHDVLPLYLQVDLTSPDKDGLRQASAVITGGGYGIDEDGYRNASVPGGYCVRAFRGEGSGSSISLSPVDGGSGSVTVSLVGDPELRSNICSCCDVREVGCVTPTLRGEISGEPDFVSIFPPALGRGECVQDFMPDNTVIPRYAPQYDENGDFSGWLWVCGVCPEGYEAQPPLGEPTQPRQKTFCNCSPDGEQFCYWKATWDSDINPGGDEDCVTGFELDFSECDNPLP